MVAEGGGWLRIMDDNVLPFDRVAITRVATTPRAARRHHPRPGGRRDRPLPPVGKGAFTGIYGATSVPGIDLHARIDDAGDALGAVAAGKEIDGLKVGRRGGARSRPI